MQKQNKFNPDQEKTIKVKASTWIKLMTLRNLGGYSSLEELLLKLMGEK